jgi:pyruvate dehydrogenase E1 component alpha subunit/2-oxoisovalerate dehydrogenase E1 component alpha subunit
MVQSLLDQDPVRQSSQRREVFVQAYRWMVLARVLDDKMASLYRMGKIHGGVFLSRGQEALSVAMGLSLEKGDVFAPLIRDTAGRLAFGESVGDAVRTYLGSAAGPMRGRDGNVHRGRPAEGLLPMISHLGSMISVVNGVLFARRLKGVTGTVGMTSLGEGGTSTGAFHEALNQASIEKLPLVLVVANNQYAYSTPNDRQFACAHLVERATAYGITGSAVDGTDLPACLSVVSQAVARARGGGGPQLVVADLLRLCGHGEHDDASYVDPKLKASALGRDCLRVAETLLLENAWAEPATLTAWREEAARKVESIVATVQREAGPDPYKEDWRALASTHLTEGHDGPVATT